MNLFTHGDNLLSEVCDLPFGVTVVELEDEGEELINRFLKTAVGLGHVLDLLCQLVLAGLI